MKRLSATVWLGLLASVLPLSAQEFSLVQKEKSLPGSAGAKKTAFIRFPEGHIDYEGSTPEAGKPSIEGVRFGLNFWCSNKTLGGWNRWDFLRVTVNFNGQRHEEIISTRLLHDVEILEDTPRRMVRFRWPLEESSAGFLKVTFLQYPNQKGWLLLRMETDGSGATIERITLSAHPGNTSGPKERERWAAADTLVFPMQNVPKQLLPVPAGLVFFNRLAQQDTGVQIVPDPEALKGVTVGGISPVRAELNLEPGITVYSLALGGFNGEETDEVIRMFALEGSRNILDFLKQADWTPRFDPKDFELLATILETLLADVGSPDDHVAFSGAAAAYSEALKSNQPEQVRQALADMRALKATLLTRALARLR